MKTVEPRFGDYDACADKPDLFSVISITILSSAVVLVGKPATIQTRYPCKTNDLLFSGLRPPHMPNFTPHMPKLK